MCGAEFWRRYYHLFLIGYGGLLLVAGWPMPFVFYEYRIGTSLMGEGAVESGTIVYDYTVSNGPCLKRGNCVVSVPLYPGQLLVTQRVLR